MQSERGAMAVATPPMLFTGAQGDDGGREREERKGQSRGDDE